ncbi:MAG TPA: hypothetical protein VGF45_12330 [Polyangia bacterium]
MAAEPPSQPDWDVLYEELVTAWLWSDRAAVLSHQTALALHGLSDILPAHGSALSPSRQLPAP